MSHKKTGFGGWSNCPTVRQTGIGSSFLFRTLRKIKLTKNRNRAHVQLLGK